MNMDILKSFTEQMQGFASVENYLRCHHRVKNRLKMLIYSS